MPHTNAIRENRSLLVIDDIFSGDGEELSDALTDSNESTDSSDSLGALFSLSSDASIGSCTDVFISIFEKSIESSRIQTWEITSFLDDNYRNIDFMLQDKTKYEFTADDLFDLLKSATSLDDQDREYLYQCFLNYLIKKYESSIDIINSDERYFLISKSTECPYEFEYLEDFIEEVTRGIFCIEELKNIKIKFSGDDENKLRILFSDECLNFCCAGISVNAMVNFLSVMPNEGLKEECDNIFNGENLDYICGNNLMYLVNWYFENAEEYNKFPDDEVSGIEDFIDSIKVRYGSVMMLNKALSNKSLINPLGESALISGICDAGKSAESMEYSGLDSFIGNVVSYSNMFRTIYIPKEATQSI